MTASRGGSNGAGGPLAGRGVIIIILAVVTGALLLAVALDNGDGSVGANTTTTAAEDIDGGDGLTSVTNDPETSVTVTPSTAPLVRAPATVVVQVANGNGVAGSAGAASNELIRVGYNAVAPANAALKSEFTFVYYQPTFQPDALLIAQGLQIPTEAVVPLPEPPPELDRSDDIHILVLLGRDGEGIISS